MMLLKLRNRSMLNKKMIVKKYYKDAQEFRNTHLMKIEPHKSKHGISAFSKRNNNMDLKNKLTNNNNNGGHILYFLNYSITAINILFSVLSILALFFFINSHTYQIQLLDLNTKKESIALVIVSYNVLVMGFNLLKLFKKEQLSRIPTRIIAGIQFIVYLCASYLGATKLWKIYMDIEVQKLDNFQIGRDILLVRHWTFYEKCEYINQRLFLENKMLIDSKKYQELIETCSQLNMQQIKERIKINLEELLRHSPENATKNQDLFSQLIYPFTSQANYAGWYFTIPILIFGIAWVCQIPKKTEIYNSKNSGEDSISVTYTDKFKQFVEGELESIKNSHDHDMRIVNENIQNLGKVSSSFSAWKHQLNELGIDTLRGDLRNVEKKVEKLRDETDRQKDLMDAFEEVLRSSQYAKEEIPILPKFDENDNSDNSEDTLDFYSQAMKEFLNSTK